MEFKYLYRFTEKAVQDFDEILRYISEDLANPIAAQNLGKKIFDKIDAVRNFPESGAPVDNEFLTDKRYASSLRIITSFTIRYTTMKR